MDKGWGLWKMGDSSTLDGAPKPSSLVFTNPIYLTLSLVISSTIVLGSSFRQKYHSQLVSLIWSKNLTPYWEWSFGWFIQSRNIMRGISTISGEISGVHVAQNSHRWCRIQQTPDRKAGFTWNSQIAIAIIYFPGKNKVGLSRNPQILDVCVAKGLW